MPMLTASGFDYSKTERPHAKRPSGRSSLLGVMRFENLPEREDLPLLRPDQTVVNSSTIANRFRIRHEESFELGKRQEPSVPSNLLRSLAERSHIRKLSLPNIAQHIPGGEMDRPPSDQLCLVVRRLLDREQIAAARKVLGALSAGIENDPQVVNLRNILALPSVQVSQNRDIDRQRDYEWIRENALSYRGQWVALDRGQLLVADKSLRVLLERIKEIEPEHRPLLHRFD